LCENANSFNARAADTSQIQVQISVSK